MGNAARGCEPANFSTSVRRPLPGLECRRFVNSTRVMASIELVIGGKKTTQTLR